MISKIFDLLACLFERHAPLRSAVHYEGQTKNAPCRTCGASLEKRSYGTWKRKRRR